MKHKHLRGQCREIWIASRGNRRVRLYCVGLRPLVAVWQKYVDEIENPLPYFPKSDAFNEPRPV